MKIQFDKRTVLLYAAAILVFLAIQFIEPFPKGTSDNYVWDYYQGMILPAVGSFFLTLLICAFAKGEKWMHPLVVVAIGIIVYAITGMDLGSGFTFASIFYGFPSFLAMGIYVLFCVLGEIGEERAEEAMRKWEEKNTGEF